MDEHWTLGFELRFWMLDFVIFLVIGILLLIYEYFPGCRRKMRERKHGEDNKRRSMEGVNRDTGAKRSSWELPTGGKSTARHVWKRDIRHKRF